MFFVRIILLCHTIEGEGETEALHSPPQYSVVQGEGERLEVIMYYYKKKGRKKQAQKRNEANCRHQIRQTFGGIKSPSFLPFFGFLYCCLTSPNGGGRSAAPKLKNLRRI